MADTKPLLDLTTLVERPIIKIDGQPYELVDPGEMSPLDFHRYMRKIEEIRAIDTATAGEAELERAAKLWDELCRSILLAPDEIHAKLKDRHRTAILQAFTALQREAAARAGSDGVAAESSGPSSIGES